MLEALESLRSWLEEHPGLLWFLGVASVASIVLVVFGLPLLLARLPADYFVEAEAPRGPMRERHPVVGAALWCARNAVGLSLVLVGIVILPLPGQGVLTILAGLCIADFPGKRRAELALVRRRGVLRAMDWMRARLGRPPFEPPR